MKNFFSIGFSVLVAGISLISCNDDEGYQTIKSAEKVRIDSVSIAKDTMKVFTVQSIKTYSVYSSRCEGFYGYDYVHTGHLMRSVTAYKYKTGGLCTRKAYTAASQINFSPQQKGTYALRFWNGNRWIARTIVAE